MVTEDSRADNRGRLDAELVSCLRNWLAFGRRCIPAGCVAHLASCSGSRTAWDAVLSGGCVDARTASSKGGNATCSHGKRGCPVRPPWSRSTPDAGRGHTCRVARCTLGTSRRGRGPRKSPPDRYPRASHCRSRSRTAQRRSSCRRTRNGSCPLLQAGTHGRVRSRP